MDGNDIAIGFGFEVFDSIYNGVVAVDQQGVIKLFNEAAAKIMGVPKDEAIGRRVEEVIPTTGLLDILKTGKAENNQKMHLGTSEIISNRGPIFKDGIIVGAVGVFQDISDFEALSLELDNVKEINNDLDAIIESVADGIVVGNSNGVISRVNSAYLQITGIQEKEFVGKNVRDLIHQGYMGKSVTEMVLKTKSRVNVVDIRNGKELLMTGAPVFDEEKEVIRVVTIVRDISELTELKVKLEQAEDAKDRYLKELEHFRSQNAFKKIITKNYDMQKKLDTAYHVARVDSTVLILGESGVGKELIAQLIHRASHRSEKPFIKINCGAIPANLLESEFFGYEAGSFTGALKEGKKGLFELADGGTLFLDEVGELPLEHQVKVLRALQEKEIQRVGGKKPIKLDIRIIAATNRDLEDMIQKKTFREDLYYRLNVVPVTIPPLRKRKEDVIPITLELLARYNTAYGYQKWIHPEVMDCLLNYDWPGNIRELENTIERLVVTSMDDCISKDAMGEIKSIQLNPVKNELTSLKAFLEKEESRMLGEAYRMMGSTRKAAAMLRISQSSMVKKMKKYGIEVPN